MTQENAKEIDFIIGILLDNLGGIRDIEATNINYFYKFSQTILNLERAKGETPKFMNWGSITSVSDNGELTLNYDEEQEEN